MKKRGFTLIELMVVVVIIGILAAIAIPNFVKVIDRAKQASVKSNMHTLQVTVEALSIDNMGRYPDDAIDLDDELPGNFKNPYTGNSEGPANDGAWNNGTPDATSEGIVYYDPENAGATYTSTSYTIIGQGKEGVTVGLTLTPGL
ncbi:prepilin-type N-terminal cleavage/methylation domain-containing protein [candidate division WOR-3 bacterium]|nr:prepilin-type N-terminal cleavage/methylation domain-containing protein [candidate division WOR-3 bacterium]